MKFEQNKIFDDSNCIFVFAKERLRKEFRGNERAALSRISEFNKVGRKCIILIDTIESLSHCRNTFDYLCENGFHLAGCEIIHIIDWYRKKFALNGELRLSKVKQDKKWTCSLLDKNDFCFIKYQIDESNVMKNFFLFQAGNENAIQEFISVGRFVSFFHTNFINDIINEYPCKKIYYFKESLFDVDRNPRLNHKNLFMISVNHNAGMNPPIKPWHTAKFHMGWENAFTRRSSYDAIVVPTNESKEDLKKNFCLAILYFLSRILLNFLTKSYPLKKGKTRRLFLQEH